MKTLLIAPLVSALALLQAPAQDHTGHQKPAAPAWTATDAYPLDTCVVSGRPFAGAKMQVVEVEGRKLKLCSAECAEKLRKDPQTYVAKLDRAVVEAQVADYPLDRCPISGKPLGSMGEPAKIVLDNHLVQLCCKGCTSKAKAKKDEIVRSIQAAAYAKQKDTYPLQTCLDSGDELDPETTIEVMHGPTLLRFGCEYGVEQLDSAPATMLARLRAARQEKAAPSAESKQHAGHSADRQEQGGSGKQEQGSGHEGHGSQPPRAGRANGHGGHGGHGGTSGSGSGGSGCGRGTGGCGR